MTGVLASMVGVTAAGGFSVTANSVTRVESGFPATGTVTTNQSPNTTVVGGVSPFSYLWERASGSTVPTIEGSNSPDPFWSGSVDSGSPETAVWEVTVTDAGGAIADTQINVTLIWNSLS